MERSLASPLHDSPEKSAFRRITSTIVLTATYLSSTQRLSTKQISSPDVRVTRNRTGSEQGMIVGSIPMLSSTDRAKRIELRRTEKAGTGFQGYIYH